MEVILIIDDMGTLEHIDLAKLADIVTVVPACEVHSTEFHSDHLFELIAPKPLPKPAAQHGWYRQFEKKRRVT